MHSSLRIIALKIFLGVIQHITDCLERNPVATINPTAFIARDAHRGFIRLVIDPDIIFQVTSSTGR